MKALLVIDMLKDFLEEGGALFCGKRARKIIPFVREKIKEAHKKKELVIFLCDAHQKNDREFKLFPAHCLKGTRGAEIIDTIDKKKEDLLVEKTRYSGFYKTNLEKVLQRYKIKEVEVLGVCTSICVMDTVGELRNRDYEVIVHKKGVADFDLQAHRFALKRMQKIYAAKIK